MRTFSIIGAGDIVPVPQNAEPKNYLKQSSISGLTIVPDGYASFSDKEPSWNEIVMRNFETLGTLNGVFLDNGYTNLPSGLKFRWGKGSVQANNSIATTINFTLPFSTPPAVIMITRLDGGAVANTYITGKQKESFFVMANCATNINVSFSYLAIGV